MTDELMYPSSAIEDICKRERDNVLDTLEQYCKECIWIEDRNKNMWCPGETNCGYGICNEFEGHEISLVLDKIAELRTAAKVKS